MNYEETLEFIHNYTWKGCTPGLDRIKELLSFMGNPQDELKYVHVAGTNGKGSTCSMLASILEKAGYKTGLFTYPHIYEFNERIKINGENITNDELCEIAEYVRSFLDKMSEKPTEFELISAMGFEYFKRKKCDIVVVEVGLGGTMDSTNVIKAPEVAVIAAIGLDHTGMLGNTVEEIALEKAGIIKQETKAVVYNQKESVNKVFIDVAKSLGVEVEFSEDDKIELVSRNLDYQEFNYKDLKNLRIPLSGTYQLKNAALVLKTVQVLKEKGYEISAGAIAEGMRDTKWPSRFEVFSKKPVIIVDGAHNPQGIAATAKSLKEHFADNKIIFVIGVMDDKDLDSMIPYIAELAGEFITVTPDYEGRALSAMQLGEYLNKYNVPVSVCDSVMQGIELALKKAGNEGIICALGSLYLTAEVENCLKMIK